MSRIDNLNKILRTLQSQTPDVDGCALVSDDGLMIASALNRDIDETRVAGMTATIASLGLRASKELGRGEVQQVMTRGKDGYTVVLQGPANTLLMVLAGSTAKLGLIFLDMDRARNDIKKVL